MIYLKLAFEFFKTGLFAIGGGIVTISFLAKMGENFGWFTPTELANMFAISESTPGPIGINMATYVGYKVGGVLGAVVATLSEVAPAIIVILIVARILTKFKESKYVDAAFKGLRPSVFGLVISAFILIVKSSLIFVDKFNETHNIKDLFDLRILFIFALVAIINKKKKLHPIIFVLISAILGIIFKL